MNNYNLKIWILNSLKKQKITKLTDIQEKSLSLFLDNKNFIGISPTGTGKTLAYVLPILQNTNLELKEYQSIIVCPTRELARQVYNVVQKFKSDNNDLRIKLWIGGLDINKLINDAKNSYGHIIICTPERFNEISKEVPNKTFKFINTFVLDEADMLLDLNFYPQIYNIIYKLDFDNVLKIAMSATLHNSLNYELTKIFKTATVINLNNIDKLMHKIDHYVIKTHDKNHALSTILGSINPYFCLIFTNTKKQANVIYQQLLNQNFNVINLHSGLSTRARKNNYKDIKNQKYQYVVASDLFSRGLDIDGASHVISYDVPNSAEWYIHRAGRTGRQKYTGISYIICLEKDIDNLQKIKNKKIDFKIKQIRDNQLVDAKLNFKKNKIKNIEQEKEIKKIISLAKKEVKPNYKKKLKNKIDKTKQKYKRKHIESKVKKQLISKYKNSQNNK